MATNPMQRRARNSFLLGMLLMLVISGVVIALLFMQLAQKNKEEKERVKVNVCILTEDVKSGQEITSSMIGELSVYKDLVPADATSSKSDIVGKMAKVDLNKNTVLTQNLTVESEEELQNDIRKQEYNVVILPADLITGDYIDIRIMFPNGQDFIVVSKKQVDIPNIAGEDSVDTIWVNLSEDEILHMSCAIIEAAKIPGTKIYANKYTDPGIQEAATPTYTVNDETYKTLSSNPNIVNVSIHNLSKRYENGNNTATRGDINQQVNAIGTDAQTKVDESITNSKNSRRDYIQSLSSPSTTSTGE